MWIVYYLHSKTLHKYYIGKTNNLDRRIKEHNNGEEKYTSKGTPWIIVGFMCCADSKEAYGIEKKLKKAKNPTYVKWYIEKNGTLYNKI